jgi:hypothetical protein
MYHNCVKKVYFDVLAYMIAYPQQSLVFRTPDGTG